MLNNVYEMSVVVSDGSLSASLGLVITVNNDTSDDVAQGPLLLETKVIEITSLAPMCLLTLTGTYHKRRRTKCHRRL